MLSLRDLQYCYLCKVLFVLFIPLQTFFWSLDYINLVYKLCIKFWKCHDTQTFLYWSVFSIDIIERLFSTFCQFLNFFFWSVNYMSRVNKFYNFFLTFSETEAKCIFKGFWYFHLWKVQFQLSSTVLDFFPLVSNKLLKSLFCPDAQKLKHQLIIETFQYCY